ncbi:hypothetical protein D3C85_1632710 [compost metagenome]
MKDGRESLATALAAYSFQLLGKLEQYLHRVDKAAFYTQIAACLSEVLVELRLKSRSIRCPNWVMAVHKNWHGAGHYYEYPCVFSWVFLHEYVAFDSPWRPIYE